MGKRGPIPLESGENALRGNTSCRPMSDAIKAPAAGRPFAPPSWMTDEQREMWRETLRHAPKNLIARIDAGILATYVVHRHAFEKLAAVCEGRAHDLSRMADPLSKHQAAMLKASQALGLDPSARARLRVEMEPVLPSKKQANFFEQLKEA
jgi:phage terminase small subunit